MYRSQADALTFIGYASTIQAKKTPHGIGETCADLTLSIDQR